MNATMQKINDTVAAYYELKRSRPIITPEEWTGASISQRMRACEAKALIKHTVATVLYRTTIDNTALYNVGCPMPEKLYHRFGTDPSEQLFLTKNRMFAQICRKTGITAQADRACWDAILNKHRDMIGLEAFYYEGEFLVPVTNRLQCFISETSGDFLRSSPEWRECPVDDYIWKDFLIKVAVSVSKIPGGLESNPNPRSIFED